MMNAAVCSLRRSSYCTSVSEAFSTAVTVSGVKSRWRGAELQQSRLHSSESWSSKHLTGCSDPEPGAASTSSPLQADGDRSGSSADTGRWTGECIYLPSFVQKHLHTLNNQYLNVQLLTQFTGQEDDRVQKHLLWHHCWKLKIEMKKTSVWLIIAELHSTT